MLKPNEKGSSKFPGMPEWFPSNLSNQFGSKTILTRMIHADHVIMYRVAIELWNQGEHGFVNVIFMDGHTGGVYLLYPGRGVRYEG